MAGVRRVTANHATGPAASSPEDALIREFGRYYHGRTAMVTGADGFVGSHLTDALVALGAEVHAFVRATSSGSLTNIGHLRGRLSVHYGDLNDRHSVDLAVRQLLQAEQPPYIFHLGAQAHVGESWERPYETVMTNTVGTLNLLQSVVDHDLELERFATAGTSEEYGNVNETVRHHHDFDENDGGVLLHERSPLNPMSIYATAKVAADFLTMNYYDAFGVPGVVTRMFNNYGPRQSPRYLTGTVITQALERDAVELGALEPMRDFCYCADGVRGHLTVASQGRPGDVYCYGQGANISVGDWASLILDIGEAEGYWPRRQLISTPARLRPGSTDVLALRVGYDKLHSETGWSPAVSWEAGVAQTIAWYASHRERWSGRVDWASAPALPQIDVA
jgi:dTDP-glucose 4,6-dehydratase